MRRNNKMHFNEIKELYKCARQEQRKLLINYLTKAGYETKIKGGKGKTNYTSGKRISSYDLSNWMYIEIKHNDYNYLISLQAFDKDPASKNIHVLYDRIGIYKYKKYISDEIIEKMYTTDIDLPINDEKFVELDKIIKSL